VEIRVANAAQQALRAKRHDDAFFERAIEEATREAAIAGIAFELPFTIQAKPIGALELWSRMFRTGQIVSIHKSIQNQENCRTEMKFPVELQRRIVNNRAPRAAVKIGLLRCEFAAVPSTHKNFAKRRLRQ
jgi:hypothetical protein